MSAADVEFLRAAYEEFSRTGELDMELLAADLDFRQPPPNALTGGREELRKAQADFLEAFDDFHVEPQEFIDAGEHVVVVVRMGGRAKETGMVIDQPIAHVWKISNGKAIRLHAYTGRAEALEAVGLPE